jgi:hypothetical protein
MRGRPLDLRGGLREIPRSVVEVEEARDDPATTGVQGEAMTTLDKRPNTALLVIGVQNGIVGGAYERDTVVAKCLHPRREGSRGGGPGRLGAAFERRPLG